MARLMLSDELWSKPGAIMRQHGIYDKSNLRLMVEAKWTGVCINTGIWSKMFLHGSNTSDQLQQDMTN